MAQGIVKWFNSEKGYGFIAPDDGSPDLFVHHSNIDMPGFRELVKDDRVDFLIGDGRDNRPQAMGVRRLGE